MNGHFIALLKLKGRVEFSEYVSPICMPLNEDFVLDRPGTCFEDTVTLAGWGMSADDSKCQTSHGGMAPFQTCGFPFVFGNQTFYQCSYTPNPSMTRKECMELHQFQKKTPEEKSKMRSPATVLVFENGTRIICWKYPYFANNEKYLPENVQPKNTLKSGDPENLRRK